MKVFIAGAGEVGCYVAEALHRERVEITVMDEDPNALERLGERLPVTLAQGNAIDHTQLERFGAGEADLFAAVTDFDETNLISCLLARELGAKRSIARVKTIELGDPGEAQQENFLSIDLIVNPYEATAEYLERLALFPDLVDLVPFLNGAAMLLALPILRGSPLEGSTVRALKEREFENKALIVLIQHAGETFVPQADTQIEPDSIVYLFCAQDRLRALLRSLGCTAPPAKHVYINGGGRIGFALARRLENRGIDVRLLEIHPQRCRLLSRRLERSLVLCGNGMDPVILREERIGDTDLFVSLTADDSVNVVSAMLAKEMGTRRTMALVKRPEAVHLLQRQQHIDVVFSPRLLTARRVLRYIRSPYLSSFFSFPATSMEVLEICMEAGMPCVNVPLAELPLPEGSLIGALWREGKLFLPGGTDRLCPGDRVLLVQHRNNHAHTQRLLGVNVSQNPEPPAEPPPIPHGNPSAEKLRHGTAADPSTRL